MSFQKRRPPLVHRRINLIEFHRNFLDCLRAHGKVSGDNQENGRATAVLLIPLRTWAGIASLQRRTWREHASCIWNRQSAIAVPNLKNRFVQ